MNTSTSTASELKQKIVSAIEKIPPEGLIEVASYLVFLNYRYQQNDKSSQITNFKPLKLGGLWKDIKVTDEDIKEARKEMWNNVDKKDLSR